MERIAMLHIEKLPEGVYLTTSDDIPELVAQGRTIAETIEIARDVARKLIEAAAQRSGNSITLPPAEDTFDISFCSHRPFKPVRANRDVNLIGQVLQEHRMNSTPADVSAIQPELAKISFSLDEMSDLKRAAAPERAYAQRMSTGLIIRLLTTAKDDAPYVLDAVDALEGVRPHSNIQVGQPVPIPALASTLASAFLRPAPHVPKHW